MTVINSYAPLTLGTVVEFVPTASFTCQSDTSAVWGPAYPDSRQEDNRPRGRFQNIQVYSHYSIPQGILKVVLMVLETYYILRDELHPPSIIHQEYRKYLRTSRIMGPMVG